MTTTPIDRRDVLRAGLALTLSAAGVAARAHEFFCSSLTVIHPWTRASAPGATSVIVSVRFEDIRRSDRLIGVDTPVAGGGELGGAARGSKLDFEIPKGEPVELSEDGP